MFPWLTPQNGYIFRIMALGNLAHVLAHGIACRNCHHLIQQPDFSTIGEDDIIAKRDERPVGCAPFGVLADYVPFYLAPRSPMLYRISSTNPRAREEVIYLVSQASLIEQKGIPFVFSDGHALMAFSRFSNQLSELSMIDWAVMQAQYWNPTPEDNDRRRRRMAEFMVHQHFPVDCIRAIVVANEGVAQVVRQQLSNFAYPIPVRIQPDWYF
ncbi:type II toxin-antitoxin system toxin DNA ADP-ribosyl transferase DarT [Spirosoma fluminis]